MSPRSTNHLVLAESRVKNAGAGFEMSRRSVHTDGRERSDLSTPSLGRSRSHTAQQTSAVGQSTRRLLGRSVSLSGAAVGLPARPNVAVQHGRTVSAPSRGGSPSSTHEKSSPANCHIPRLSISSEDGTLVEEIHAASAMLEKPLPDPPVQHHREKRSIPRLDTWRNSLDLEMQEAVLEMAMEIMEELARLCESPWPPPTDISLRSAGLDGGMVKQFQYWLNMRFDHYYPSARLLDEGVTGELLALEIHARSRRHAAGREKQSPPALRPKAFRDAKNYESVSPHHLSPTMAMKRVRKDLSIDIVEDRTNSYPRSPSPPSSGPVRSPKPYQQPYSHQSSRKTGGLLIGLLTVGTMFGSPLMPHFELGGSLQQYATPISPLHPVPSARVALPGNIPGGLGDSADGRGFRNLL